MLPQFKPQIAINAVSVGTSGGTLVGSPIDTLGARWATIDIWGTTQSATTQAAGPSVLKLQESDTTVASTFADIVGFRGGSATATNVDFVVGLGYATTNLPNNYKFNVDCRYRKRYLSVAITAISSQTFYGTANLYRNEQSPSTATKAGVLSLVEG